MTQAINTAITNVPAPLPAESDLIVRFLHIPAWISVDAAVVSLTVRELFRLEKGSVVVTSQPSGANAPVRVGKSVIAWGEIQVVGENLAIRVAELA